jgi:tRNA (guanine37-N1)-methyltransferase
MNTNDTKDTLLKNRVAGDHVFYADVADTLRRGAGEIQLVCAGGFLLHNIPGEVMIAEADDDKTFTQIAAILSKTKSGTVLLHGRAYAGALSACGYTEDLVCRQYVYLKDTPLPVRTDGFEIRRIPGSYARRVNRLYTRMEDPGYIASRMQAGMYGAFIADRLCGTIGTHAEGSIGLLEVDPAFRKMAIGRAHRSLLINKMLAEGRIPYGQVVVGNDASDSSSKKCLAWRFHKERSAGSSKKICDIEKVCSISLQTSTFPISIWRWKNTCSRMRVLRAITCFFTCISRA